MGFDLKIGPEFRTAVHCNSVFNIRVRIQDPHLHLVTLIEKLGKGANMELPNVLFL